MINYNSIAAISKDFPDEQSCISHLETLRWNGFAVSPFNPISKVYRCKDRYRCSITGKYFNVKTGTLFHNSKIPLQQWFLAIWIVTIDKPNITSVALSQDLKITQKTSWYMIQRIKVYYDIPMKASISEKKWPLSKNRPMKKIIDQNVTVAIEKDKFALLDWLQILKK